MTAPNPSCPFCGDPAHAVVERLSPPTVLRVCYGCLPTIRRCKEMYVVIRDPRRKF
jgi:hypothetical protein